MKLFLSVSIASTVLFAGCSKQEDTTAPDTTPAPPSASSVETSQKSATAAAAELQAQATNLQAAAQATTTSVANAVETAVRTPEITPPAIADAPAPGPAQSVFDQVKTLMSQKRYAEALAALTQLRTADLSAEQQRVVEQLRTQIQNAIASQTANEGMKSVGGLLKGNQ